MASFRPFLRWPGGRDWFADDVVRLAARIGPCPPGVFDAFVGNGRALLALASEGMLIRGNVVIADMDRFVMSVWGGLCQDPMEMCTIASRLMSDETVQGYWDSVELWNEVSPRLRMADPRGMVVPGAHALHINALAEEGRIMYDDGGLFDVPYGGPEWEFRLEDALRAGYGLRDMKALVVLDDFEKCVKLAVTRLPRGSLFIIDPVPEWSELMRPFLADAIDFLGKRGMRVAASDHDVEEAEVLMTCLEVDAEVASNPDGATIHVGF